VWYRESSRSYASRPCSSTPAAGGRQVAPVIPIGSLARYDRPAPALDAYEELLIRTIP
jgi:hypothetical protein